MAKLSSIIPSAMQLGIENGTSTASMIQWSGVLHQLQDVGLVEKGSFSHFSFQYRDYDMATYLCYKQKPLGEEFFGETEQILYQKLKGLVALAK